MPHSAYSETLYQAGSWSHKRRVCQFSERKEETCSTMLFLSLQI
ncbi:putative transposase [Streptococcus pneumoniae GA41410]|nr:putative transposase [Streptococcus pneumoniae GA41410]